MYFPSKPQFAWMTMLAMCWAYIAMPVLAADATDSPAPLPPAVSDAPVSETMMLPSSGGRSRVGGYLDQPSPGTDTDSETPQLQVNGDSKLQQQLRALVEMQSQQPVDLSQVMNPLNGGSGLDISGTLGNHMSLQATMAPANSDYSETRWTLGYDEKGTKVQLGEIPAALAGNDLVSLQRTVQGLQIDSHLGKGSVTGIVSKVKSQVQTESLQGMNTSGPYYLHATPVVQGSESVTLNGRKLTRNTDYVLDYNTGTLTFTRGQLITSTDQVNVSYEVLVDGTGGGQLLALRGSYPVSNNLTVGVSHVGLSGQDTKDAIRNERDEFQGNGTEGPFYLTYRPIVANSDTLTVNGIKQNKSTTYTLNYDNGELTFLRGHYPPYGASLVVNYRTVTPGQSSPGRSVTGIDVDWKNDKGLTLNLQAAKSGGTVANDIVSQSESIVDEQLVPQVGLTATAQIFHLRNTPILAGSESVTALSKTLTRNYDYRLNEQTGELRLLRNPFPGISQLPTLLVSYTTAPKTAKPKGDTAMTASAAYSNDNIKASARYRTMSPGFTPLSLSNADLVEHALDWSSSFSPTKSLTLSTTGADTTRPANSSALYGAGQEKTRSYAVNYHKEGTPSVMVRRTTRTSSTAGTDQSQQDDSVSDNITTSWSKDKISTTLSLDRTTTKTQRTTTSTDAATTAETSSQKNQVNSATLNVMYQPNQKVDMTVNVGANTVNSTDEAQPASKTNGKSFQGNVTYHPNEKLSVSADMQSFNTGGSSQADGTSISSQQSKSMMLNAEYKPTDKVTVGANYLTDSYSDGEYGANATSTTSANIGWRLSDTTSLTSYWVNQRQQDPFFMSSTKSQLLGLGAQFSPFKNTTMNLDVQHLWGNSGDGVNQLWQVEGQARRAPSVMVNDASVPTMNATKMNIVSGNLNYQVGDKQSLMLTGELAGGDGEGGKSRRSALGIGWRFTPNIDLSFSLDARRVRYTEGASSESGFSANEINAELNWQF